MGNASTTRRRLLGGVAGLGAAAGMFGRRVRGQDADPSASPSPSSCIPSAGATASPVAPWASPPVSGTIRVVLAITPCAASYMSYTKDLKPIADILNIQIQQHFKQFWDVDATVDIAPNNTYPDAWMVKFMNTKFGEQGCLTGTPVPSTADRRNGHGFDTILGRPFAWVFHDKGNGYLAHATSHECLELLANPNLDITYRAPTLPTCPGATPVPSGNVDYLQEVCDPCPFHDPPCYLINGEVVSNFVTPAYFDSSNAGTSRVRLDFLNQISNPFQPVDGASQNFQVPGQTNWQEAIWHAAGCCAEIRPL